jgi:hypothetical protein
VEKRRSGSVIHDGKNYYQNYDPSQSVYPAGVGGGLPHSKSGTQFVGRSEGRMNGRDSVQEYFNDNLVGECFLGFSKLLQSELRKYEKRDSTILSNRLTKMSNRLSVMAVPIGGKGGPKKGLTTTKAGAMTSGIEMDFGVPSRQ